LNTLTFIPRKPNMVLRYDERIREDCVCSDRCNGSVPKTALVCRVLCGWPGCTPAKLGEWRLKGSRRASRGSNANLSVFDVHKAIHPDLCQNHRANIPPTLLMQSPCFSSILSSHLSTHSSPPSQQPPSPLSQPISPRNLTQFYSPSPRKPCSR